MVVPANIPMVCGEFLSHERGWTMSRIVTVVSLVVATLLVAATPAAACTSPNWVEMDATDVADVRPGAT